MKKRILYTLCMLITLSSCEKYVDVGSPRDQLDNTLAFSDDKTATASVVGVYTRMNALNYYFANVLTTFLGAMSADEFKYGFAFANYDEFWNNSPSPNNQYISIFWSQPYTYIYHANACIEGLNAATGLSEAVKNQLLGEALFMRAFCHFYLVNLFGDVPLILSTDYRQNTLLPRTPTAEVYASIIQDLQQAKGLMVMGYPSGENVNSSNGERIRPNKAVATALLARAYLYNEQWGNAESEASEVISDQQYTLLQGAAINNVFLKNSQETLWQLQAVNVATGRNTWEGTLLVPVTQPLFRLLPELYQAFEDEDLRKQYWVGSYTSGANTFHYPYKYKVRLNVTPATEYSMVMRFAELYLIRAEARIRQESQDKLSGARTDLNTLRQRAALDDLPQDLSGPQLLAALEQERRIELFAEWGHRWFDLKRWPSILTPGQTRADDVLGALKPDTWTSSAVFFPLPIAALQTNPNLIPD